MGNYTCARPIHPGEVLKDEIVYRGISQSKIAAQIGMPYKTLNNILNERRPLTTATAMLFEASLGVPAYALMRMQLEYNMQVAQKDKKLLLRLAKIREIAALF
jgi:addiction module HigA family antidote